MQPLKTKIPCIAVSTKRTIDEVKSKNMDADAPFLQLEFVQGAMLRMWCVRFHLNCDGLQADYLLILVLTLVGGSLEPPDLLTSD